MSYLQEILARLVAEDTVSSRGDAAAMGWIGVELERHGFRVRLQEWGEGGGAKANLVAVAGPPEPGGLVLSGHLDVVPFADQPGWTRDPLRLEGEGDRLYGRGTADMKGFLAQCLEAARRLDPSRLRRPLVLLFTSDEEIGCLGAGRLAAALPELLGEVPPPRLAWIGEPTSWSVFHAHKGVVAFDVLVEGSGGHSSRPEAGVNAIAVATRAAERIGALQEELRRRRRSDMESLFPEAPYTTLNFGTVRGGTASNMIAERCRLGLSYRPLPDEDPLSVYREVEARLADPPRDWGSPAGRARLRLSPPRVAPGMWSRPGSILERALAGRLGGGAPGGAPYCTDGGQLAQAGIEALICGPGELDQAHQPDESLSRAALEEGPDHLLAVIEALCSRRELAEEEGPAPR